MERLPRNLDRIPLKHNLNLEDWKQEYVLNIFAGPITYLILGLANFLLVFLNLKDFF